MQLALTSSIHNDSFSPLSGSEASGVPQATWVTTRWPQKQRRQSVIHTHGMRGRSLGWGIKDYTSLYNVGLRIFTGVFGREIF